MLNEHEQTPQVNLDASIMSHMMQLKRDHPLPDVAVLDEKEFDLNLNRDEFCAKADELDKFDRKHPTWGMPYALPGLADSEFALLQGWLKQGAQMAQPPAYGPEAQALVTGMGSISERRQSQAAADEPLYL